MKNLIDILIFFTPRCKRKRFTFKFIKRNNIRAIEKLIYEYDKNLHVWDADSCSLCNAEHYGYRSLQKSCGYCPNKAFAYSYGCAYRRDDFSNIELLEGNPYPENIYHRDFWQKVLPLYSNASIDDLVELSEDGPKSVLGTKIVEIAENVYVRRR